MTEQTQSLQAKIAEIWLRSRDTVVERAELLQFAGKQWALQSLDEATRLKAVDSAHKLAGILGLFGLPQGTELAREAEVLFSQAAPTSSAELERLQSMLNDLSSLIETGPATLS